MKYLTCLVLVLAMALTVVDAGCSSWADQQAGQTWTIKNGGNDLSSTCANLPSDLNASTTYKFEVSVGLSTDNVCMKHILQQQPCMNVTGCNIDCAQAKGVGKASITANCTSDGWTSMGAIHFGCLNTVSGCECPGTGNFSLSYTVVTPTSDATTTDASNTDSTTTGDVLGGGDDCPSLKESTCGLAPSCSWSSGSCVFSECSDSSDLCIGLFSQGVCSTPVISLYPDAPAGERDLVSGGCRKECKLCVADTGPTEQEVYVTMAMTFDQAIDAAQEIQIADKIKTIYLNKLPDSVSNVTVSIQPSRRRRRHLLEGVEYTVTITITVEATAQELTTEFDRVKSELAPEYYTGDETFQALIQADVETLGVTVTVSEPIIQCSLSTTFDCGGSQLAPFTGIVGVLLAVRLLAL